MTDHDYEILSQYLDGELPAEETRELERRLAAETPLRETLDRLRRADDHVRALANAPGCDRVPLHIAAMLEAPRDTVVPFPSPRGRTGVGLAIAASLVAAAGLLLAPQWQDSQNDGTRDSLVAGALESTPSSADGWTALADGSQLRPVLSFAGTDGHWCREYQLNAGEQHWRGVACRDEAGWHTALLVDDKTLAANANAYQPAGAGDVDAISAFIDDHATDIPLSASEEAALIANDWQSRQ